MIQASKELLRKVLIIMILCGFISGGILLSLIEFLDWQPGIVSRVIIGIISFAFIIAFVVILGMGTLKIDPKTKQLVSRDEDEN